MAEAIAKKDLIRIRSGSPGIRSGATKLELSNGKSFATEMKDKGISEDLNSISKFTFVLMSRSQNIEESTASVAGQQVSKPQKMEDSS